MSGSRREDRGRSGPGAAAVSIRGLEFGYDGRSVLADVDLDIAAGDFVSIVGPNGSGKTTLLRLILGLLRPRRGTVRVFGLPPDRVRRRMGHMPQRVQLDPQFPVNVEDVVLMGRLGLRAPLGPFRRADHRAAAAALADAEALDLKDRPFASLSGGQRQRVLIARALATEPDLLLLDEPTASLDPAVQDDVYDLLHRLNERMTVVIVSHDIGVVSRHVDKVICVNVRVVQHPVSEVTGELARHFYGGDSLRLVDHHRHLEE